MCFTLFFNRNFILRKSCLKPSNIWLKYIYIGQLKMPPQNLLRGPNAPL